MSEFCTACASKYGMKPDIDLYGIIRRLKPGDEMSVVCEGCGYVAVDKDDEGNVWTTDVRGKRSRLIYEDELVSYKKSIRGRIQQIWSALIE